MKIPRDRIKAVFSDLDDTITEKSRVIPKTYSALWRLKEKGLRLVLVSGRPAGWADCLMRLWPLDAMVFENGAGVMVRDGNKIKAISLAADSERDRQIKILRDLYEKLKQTIPHLRLATDQPYRLFDFAIDYAEEPPGLTEPELRWVLETLGKEPSITAKLSSIHVNYWCGTHTKVTACRYLLDTLGQEWGIRREEILYCGDSPNDEPMFEYFDETVGVANIAPYLPIMKHLPRYFTNLPAGQGFVEIADHLLSQA